MLLNDDGLTPNHGELVICDNCGKQYKFFIWAFGNDSHLCRKCVNKRPQSYLDDIDAIDIGKEHDIIHAESDEQDQRDFPRNTKARVHRKRKRLSRYTSLKIQREQDRQTIKKFRQKEGSAIDVTGLG